MRAPELIRKRLLAPAADVKTQRMRAAERCNAQLPRYTPDAAPPNGPRTGSRRGAPEVSRRVKPDATSALSIRFRFLSEWPFRSEETMRNWSRRHDDLLNELTDSDVFWGPLLWLRPAPDQTLGHRSVAALAAFLGGVHGAGANVGLALARRATGDAVMPFFVLPLVLSLAAWACFHLTIVQAWNRRTRLIHRRRHWVGSAQSERELLWLPSPTGPDASQSPPRDQA